MAEPRDAFQCGEHGVVRLHEAGRHGIAYEDRGTSSNDALTLSTEARHGFRNSDRSLAARVLSVSTPELPARADVRR
jgi:hypothetical protein